MIGIIFGFIFMLGTALGSFVNMLVFRTAVAYGLKKGKVRPKIKDQRSVCDFCGRQLTWKENIPIISWVIQRGKSKCCRTPLPRQYPIVELAAGLAAVITTVKLLDFSLNNWIILVVVIGLVTLMILETVFDLKYMILPDYATAIMAVLAVIYTIYTGGNWPGSLGGAAIGAAVIGGIYAVTRGRGMGLGDVKLMPVLGWWLGWKLTIVALYLAFIGGATTGLILLALRIVRRKQPIPFGPFLLAGAYIAWWGGQRWAELAGKLIR